MDTTLGDFAFNAMYLVHKASDTVAMVVHKETDADRWPDPGSHPARQQPGEKVMLMEYEGAGEATQTQVDASTWQIDFTARLMRTGCRYARCRPWITTDPPPFMMAPSP
jgi:hypothetical protein